MPDGEETASVFQIVDENGVGVTQGLGKSIINKSCILILLLTLLVPYTYTLSDFIRTDLIGRWGPQRPY